MPKQIFILVNRSLPNVSLTSVGAVRIALSSVGPIGPCGASHPMVGFLDEAKRSAKRKLSFTRHQVLVECKGPQDCVVMVRIPGWHGGHALNIAQQISGIALRVQGRKIFLFEAPPS